MVSKRNRVFVELGIDGRAIRIYRHHSCLPLSEPIIEWSRQKAVSDIREQVFERADGQCERCARPINSQTAHLHEVRPRGQGGEVSVANGQALCPKCHLGKAGVHADHYPQFGLKKE